jgi:hypothetical protein
MEIASIRLASYLSKDQNSLPIILSIEQRPAPRKKIAK